MFHTLQLDSSFPRHYDCEQVDELPSGRRYYFPGASTEGGRDGPIEKITPYSGDSWVGIFAFGHVSSTRGKNGLFTFPDPDLLCVVSQGTGYLVEASNPKNWKPIEVYPICEVTAVSQKNLIVFGDFTELTAFSKTGLLWRTKRLAWDDLKITQVTDSYIEGETWDFQTDGNVFFQVDLATGEHKGGITGV